jgi:hypothetical protein
LSIKPMNFKNSYLQQKTFYNLYMQKRCLRYNPIIRQTGTFLKLLHGRT